MLAYVGVKMMLSHVYPIPNLVSLAIIGGLLSVGVIASLVATRRNSSRQRAMVTTEISTDCQSVSPEKSE